MIKYFLTIIIICLPICNAHSGNGSQKNNKFTVKIDKIKDVIQGQFQDVDIYFEGTTADISSFIITISFDGSTLSFNQAFAGNIFEDYQWEYFNYEYITCPLNHCYKRFVRITGIAEYDSIEPNPNNYTIKENDVFTRVSFLVTNDISKACIFTPIKFYWFNSLDNSFESYNNDKLFSNHVIGNVSSSMIDLKEENVGYPTFKGIPESFISNLKDISKTRRLVKFKDGGFRIACPPSIEKYGDVNFTETLDNKIINFCNYPNPFNPKTTISFDMTESGLYKLIIFNISGQIVNEYQGFQTAGTVNIEWDASSMASGIYFYKVVTNNFTATKKMLLLK